MDKLEEIFKMQAALDADIIARRGLEGITPAEWIQKLTLATVSELSELLDEVNFKWWKNPKELDIPSIKGELVDVLHFFVSMCNRVGLSADEIYKLYLEKNEENFKRQQGTSQKKGYSVNE
jgi:dimeric dUTPase (all-alpha-NTP-PPase superfamily)